jgi:hypothetical protein
MIFTELGIGTALSSGSVWFRTASGPVRYNVESWLRYRATDDALWFATMEGVSRLGALSIILGEPIDDTFSRSTLERAELGDGGPLERRNDRCAGHTDQSGCFERLFTSLFRGRGTVTAFSSPVRDRPAHTGRPVFNDEKSIPWLVRRLAPSSTE